ncbi:pantoate--beta-alanine ligase [Alphaproteobacteria bacterium]|nr:pantoate--beta-alanine ligase [Alphaproteobacteria bacterium]
MKIIKNISEITQIVSDLHKNKKQINLIPTMGNIHAGHLSLLTEAKKFNGTNIVSIFVNPAQFNEENDFTNYPKTFDRDVDLLAKAHCEIIFAPSIKEIYPRGTNSEKTVLKYRDILCDISRSGHFDGVTTIVKILFDLIKPFRVFFGEKDFQQLKIIEQLIIQNNLKINLIKCPSIRDLNGMSYSSRYSTFSQNQRLQFDECAKIINSKLINLKKNLNQEILQNIEDELKSSGISNIDYCEVRSEENLNISKLNEKSRLFIAFYLSKIRVIDNFILY